MAGSLSCCYQYADHAMLLMLMMCMANMLDVFGEQLLFGAITHHSIIRCSSSAWAGAGTCTAGYWRQHQHIYVLAWYAPRTAQWPRAPRALLHLCAQRTGIYSVMRSAHDIYMVRVVYMLCYDVTVPFRVVVLALALMLLLYC